jgi:hypothetical protein
MSAPISIASALSNVEGWSNEFWSETEAASLASLLPACFRSGNDAEIRGLAWQR